MLKNDKGITLTALVVTVIVIIILAGTIFTASDMLIRETKAKSVVSNMMLIRGKAAELYDTYTFNDVSEEDYAGRPTASLSAYGVTPTATDKWYVWNRNTIKELGFDPNMLQDDSTFIVNYVTGEVIYTNGVKDIDGIIKYTLSDLKN